MGGVSEEFREMQAGMRGVYERQAEFWDKVRSRSLAERKWLDRFIQALPEGGRVLDLGCGMGEPIAAYLISHGFSLVGVDYSAPMIERARARYPDASWLVQDMTCLDIQGRFDGIIGWDSFFHLSRDAQRALIGDLPDMLRTGGAFMATVGTDDGEVSGAVGGEAVYHASLARTEYLDLLREQGFASVTHFCDDADGLDRTVLFASGRST